MVKYRANDEQTSGIVSTPKGGLYGGVFDPTGFGIDPNTLALLIDARWTTMFNGPNPATTIPYAFPAQASDYTAGANLPEPPQYLTGFAPPLTADQMAATKTSLRAWWPPTRT